MSAQESDTTEFELPEDATYGEYEILEAGYNRDLQRVYVVYAVDEEYHLTGWEQLIFDAEERDGEVTVTTYPAGLVPPSEARNQDTPGANASEGLYDLLRDVGVSFPTYE